MSWQRWKNFVTTFGCSSGGTTCPKLPRQHWLVDLFDDDHYHNMLWQSLNSSTSSQQVVTTTHNTVERQCQTVIEGGVRVCGIAVLGYFWCGVAVIFVSKYGIAVFRVQAVCGKFKSNVAVICFFFMTRGYKFWKVSLASLKNGQFIKIGSD